MDSNIKIIFDNNIQLITLLDKASYYFRIQNYDQALKMSNDFIYRFNSNISILFSMSDYFNKEQILVDNINVLRMLQDILIAQEKQDYILLSDLYQLHLIPFLIILQEEIIRIEGKILNQYDYEKNLSILKNQDNSFKSIIKQEPNLKQQVEHVYEMEYTSCGLMTLVIKDNKNRYYIHSNHHMIDEAFQLALSWYEEDKNTYIVYGLGLGYHIYELCSLNLDNYVEVYESDLNIIQLACSYTDICYVIENLNIKIIYDPDLILLQKRLTSLDSNTEFVVHHPSLRNINNQSMRENLEEYFIKYSSIKNQTTNLNNNFKKNILNYDTYIDELKKNFVGKDLYIIAAGPSLDKNYQQINKINNENSIILATGTVYKKLLYSEIVPDYVIITDANRRVYQQVMGVEDRMVPMLVLSTAYQKFSENYQGKKYLICQYGYPNAEQFAKEQGYNLYHTGGSVSTTALDIGIELGCKRIIFLGLDLAYTDNFVHAEGTSRRDVDNTEGLITVNDINGKQIYTTKVLNIYRRWIENRIKDVKGIEFIDATEGGAKIEGMRIAKLSEVIEN